MSAFGVARGIYNRQHLRDQTSPSTQLTVDRTSSVARVQGAAATSRMRSSVCASLARIAALSTPKMCPAWSTPRPCPISTSHCTSVCPRGVSLRQLSPPSTPSAQHNNVDEQTARTHLARVTQRWDEVLLHAVVHRVQILDVEGRIRDGGVEDVRGKQVVPGDTHAAHRGPRGVSESPTVTYYRRSSCA